MGWLLDADRLVVAEGDGREHRHARGEGVGLAVFDGRRVDGGAGNRLDAVLADGLLVALVDQFFQPLLIDGVFPQHALDHRAGSLAPAEARHVVLLRQLLVGALGGLFELVPLQFDVQDGLAICPLLYGHFHGVPPEEKPRRLSLIYSSPGYGATQSLAYAIGMAKAGYVNTPPVRWPPACRGARW